MKIVCFSYNSPPMNDPEAFCTARFLSALARAGLDVELVTVAHPRQIEDSVCQELLNPRLKVTRFPLIETDKDAIYSIIKYHYFSENFLYLNYLIDEMRAHLKKIDNPILVTRGFPNISNIIGYHLRKYVKLWVAHFSDPYPAIGSYSGRTRHYQLVDSWWAKRILRNADLISVTNRNAIRWFREKHNPPSNTKFHITYHVGCPPLSYQDENIISFDAGFVNFLHVGFWARRRYMEDVFRGFKAAHKCNSRIMMHQIGIVDPGVNEFFELESHDWLYLNSSLISPRKSSAYLASNSINVVIDQNDNHSFCPYLASKFAYAVASGQPLLAIGQHDSEMYYLYKKHGSFYFCDITQSNALENTLLMIADSEFNELKRPNVNLKKIFSPQEVAEQFISSITKLI